MPESIAEGILDTLSSKDIFDKLISIYQNILYESGFKKELNYTPSDKRKVADKVYGNANSTMCKLCLTEKLRIIDHINDNNVLNKKSELNNKTCNNKTCKEKTVNVSFMRICIFVFFF